MQCAVAACVLQRLHLCRMTILTSQALKILLTVLYGLQVSTYQAASGAGQAAMDELEQQTREVLAGEEVTTNIFPFQARA